MSGYVGSKRSSSLVSATEITLDGAKLKSSGNSITKSDGTTAVLSESAGVVTLNNGTIGSGVVFPAGHVLRVFANTYVPSSDFGVGTTGITLSDLELSITNPSTNNFLVIHTNFVGSNNQVQNERLDSNIRYSTDNFSTETTIQTGIGAVGRVYSAAGSILLMTTQSYVNYVNHPTNSDYKIRPFVRAAVGTFYLLGGTVHSIVCYEIKG